MPFVLRTWMYASGVFYSVAFFAEHLPRWASLVVQANPLLVYIELVRYALMDRPTARLAGERAVAHGRPAGRRGAAWSASCTSGAARRGTAVADDSAPPRAGAGQTYTRIPSVVVEDVHVVYRVQGPASTAGSPVAALKRIAQRAPSATRARGARGQGGQLRRVRG